MTDTQHVPDLSRLTKIMQGQNPAFVLEAIRQEKDRQRLRRLFGPATR
ncbi:hypothetical protein PBI_KRATIO_84 [Mycobacterium phage Kratio]|nr:hypothetical protein PBI_KRATIO_84 [Mycobacterium phage Kratio]AJK27413.1 hypothetical protein PBI_KRATIO_84 [Mycobacterium phage Kratio]ASM62590.1 hypothetical protein SEA_ALLEYCAT_84 [Mycobacterium phage AlleyCat]WAB09765.1 hypothetical protein SEA_DADOSKY_84 [Mycobacterium phage Dadosky]